MTNTMALQGKSSLKKHLGFFKSSHAEKAASKEPGQTLFNS